MVPSDYPSLQAAIDNPGCLSVLIDQAFLVGDAQITRSINISGRTGFGSTVLGQLSITGFSTQVELADLHIDTSIPELAGCYDRAIFIGSGARVRTDRVRASNRSGNGSCIVTDQLFEDRFEL
jgi:hypothetical protein